MRLLVFFLLSIFLNVLIGLVFIDILEDVVNLGELGLTTLHISGLSQI